MKALLLATGILVAAIAAAQPGMCPSLPDPTKWQEAEDYAADRERIEDILAWLCRTPLGQDVKRRSEANACVMEWLAGTPEVRVEVEAKKLPFLEDHPDLLFTVIHGMALYQLKHPKEADPVRLHAEGLEVVHALAEQSDELSHDKALKPLRKAVRKRRLPEYTRGLLHGTH